MVDGEVEVLKETREHLRLKVDWIKVFATGGFGSFGTIPGASSFNTEEMAVAVKEAAKLGIPVAAHAHGKEGIINAIDAGVHSIEHATFLDQGLQLMKEKGVFLSMDLYAAYYAWFVKGAVYEDKQLKGSNEEQFKDIQEKFRMAVNSGVPMVFSTDAGEFPHGDNAKQFKLMIESGMPELVALQSATITAAQLLRQENDLGSLEVGKIADIIAIKGAPLKDITALEEVYFVMKGGVIYKQPDR